MLTKQDLNAIGGIIDDKLEEKLESKLEEKLAPIKKDIKKIQKTLDTAIDRFDQNDIKIVDNVRKIQTHLNLPVMDYV